MLTFACQLPHRMPNSTPCLQTNLLGKKGGGKKKPLPAMCSVVKDAKACVKKGAEEGGCSWCEGAFMPAACMSEKVRQHKEA